MRLTEAQKLEVSNYIATSIKYRETHNELYDHIINAINDNEGYSEEIVAKIVNQDFGGFKNIQATELDYQKQLNKKYMTAFRYEMLNTFKWPGLLGNLAIFSLCTILYFSSKSQAFNSKPMLGAILICFSVVGVFGFYKIISNKLKFLKYSILDNYLAYICSLGIVLMNLFLYFFISKNSLFAISDNLKLISMLALFFLASIYVRSFIKFYNKKLKVLTA